MLIYVVFAACVGRMMWAVVDAVDRWLMKGRRWSGGDVVSTRGCRGGRIPNKIDEE